MRIGNGSSIVRALLALTAVGGTSLLSPSSASAAIITASEIIYDTTCTAPGSSGGCQGNTSSDRDLVRKRTLGSGSPVTVNNDSTIVSENAVSSSFAMFNANDVTYKHLLTWISPFPSSFISAVLTVKSYGASGSNDNLYTDNVLRGHLGNGGNIITTSSWGSLQASLNDGLLSVRFDKSSGDSITFFSSRLDVTFNDAPSGPPPMATPEPTSLVLVGSAVAGFVGRRMRRKGKNTERRTPNLERGT